ncbi:membrane-associated protein, putative [Bodo saltans]|uniref:Membrane-associated protein, putative n=1 Tax=Bodo saltans TaxID=75058 RepID=A0A0S4KK31_BODSA|nr:membrane-associated protein, putative [Bodo saltans]|eukprot:CUI14917.1 membrane-associated protein, putative [Bodo saltans]
MLLTETMDSTKCKGFSALDASFDTSCLVLLLGFYYSLMAVRWNPIRSILRTLCESCCGSDRTYQHVRHFGWFLGASGVAAATGYFTATDDTQFGFMLGWCTGFGSSWIFAVTNLAPLVLLVTTAVLTMLALRCCVSADGGKGIAQELTWKGHWTVYVRFFAVIVFFLAAIHRWQRDVKDKWLLGLRAAFSKSMDGH